MLLSHTTCLINHHLGAWKPGGYLICAKYIDRFMSIVIEVPPTMVAQYEVYIHTNLPASFFPIHVVPNVDIIAYDNPVIQIDSQEVIHETLRHRKKSNN